MRVERDSAEEPLPVFVSETHPQFICPVTQNDVKDILGRIPNEFLLGHEYIFILGGSSKQIKAQKLFRYGCYSSNKVFLHAFPKILITQCFSKPLSPARAQEYEIAGATISQLRGKYTVIKGVSLNSRVKCNTHEPTF